MSADLAENARDPHVSGFCPMGCGQSLFVGAGGFITCSYVHCPEPDAVATILDENEREHIVVLGKKNFTVRHPLRERTSGQLEDCKVHAFLSELDGPPAQLGTYQVTVASDGPWGWVRERVEDQS